MGTRCRTGRILTPCSGPSSLSFRFKGHRAGVSWGGWACSQALTPVPCPQILTQEDWNKVLYNGMASTSSWAALYFIALMTFGNYVLFNLLVAILVEGFQAEVTSYPAHLILMRAVS